jgi:hypothetical protein
MQNARPMGAVSVPGRRERCGGSYGDAGWVAVVEKPIGQARRQNGNRSPPSRLRFFNHHYL